MNSTDLPSALPSTEPSDAAVTAAIEIARDISDRRGLGQEWDQIAPVIKAGIIETWAKIIHDNSYGPPSAD
jgi:hypothetical protein